MVLQASLRLPPVLDDAPGRKPPGVGESLHCVIFMLTIILRVRYKWPTREWVVTTESNGVHKPELTYFTNDEQDALDTRIAIANVHEAAGHTVILQD